MEEQRYTKWLIGGTRVTTEKPMTIMECAKLFNPAFVHAIPEIKLEDAYDHDIYYVEETSDGGKELNVQRYYYDDENINIVEYCGVRLPIPTTREDFENAILESKQYGGPVSLDREEAEKMVREDLAVAVSLPIDKVTENTPCGMYIDI